jgi:hypothetical protein
MISAYRAKLYRLIFALAAIYNIAFGLWACLWPRAFFTSLEMAPPNYPGLWQCLGMVVGFYGVLYASAAWRLDRAKLIIAIGLAGKILGPIGLIMTIHSGEWPLRALSLVVCNDLIWWLPFTLFLLEGTRSAERLRAAAPWLCFAEIPLRRWRWGSFCATAPKPRRGSSHERPISRATLWRGALGGGSGCWRE